MEVLNDLLDYKLKIYQNSQWFRFSLDSVLLAEFIKIKKADKTILDLGTGNAPIPLILSKKTFLPIKAVEIQKDIADLAKKSVLYNHLENQINIINIDMKEFALNSESDQYDIIISNPPYFKNNDCSFQNSDIHKAIARHEIMITLEEIIIIARKLLKNNGSFYLVQRPERLLEIIKSCQQANLEPKRLRICYTNSNNATLFLLECVKNGKSGLTIESPQFI
ncbi:MAG: methyltransferase [Bacilli bacterium]